MYNSSMLAFLREYLEKNLDGNDNSNNLILLPYMARIIRVYAKL